MAQGNPPWQGGFPYKKGVISHGEGVIPHGRGGFPPQEGIWGGFWGKPRHAPAWGWARRNCTVFCRISAFSALGFRRRWGEGLGVGEGEEKRGGGGHTHTETSPQLRLLPVCRDTMSQ